VAISLKRIKIEEKLLWRAYRNSLMLFQTVPTRPPTAFPKIGGSQPPPKTPISIISGMGKATNFKFCTHIHRINQNKSPLKILGKVAVGVLRDSQHFQGTHIQAASRGHLCNSSAFLLSTLLFISYTFSKTFTAFHVLTCH